MFNLKNAIQEKQIKDIQNWIFESHETQNKNSRLQIVKKECEIQGLNWNELKKL